MYRVLFFVLLLMGGVISISAQNSLTFNLTDNRKVITRNVNKDLLLRIIKDSSVSQKDFGWLVEVVRRPPRKNSRNLIYTNALGVGADPSQVMAWQVGDSTFPSNRRVQVRGFPYVVNIVLIAPRAEGKASDSYFLTGKLKISWKRQKSNQ